MDSVTRRNENISVAPNLALSERVKKKSRRLARKARKGKKLGLVSLEPENGLFFPGLHFISKPECRALYKQAADEFVTWLSWQKKIALCGLTEKCSKSLLKTMGTVIEPVLHESFECTASFSGGKILSNSVTEERNESVKERQYPSSTKSLSQPEPKKAMEVGAFEFGNMHSEVPQDPFLPSIEPQRQSITLDRLRNTAYTAHKHCREDEYKYRRKQQFFPDIMHSRTTGLGKICTSRDILNSETSNHKYNSRIFKNRKFWSLSATDSMFLAPNGNLLLENFRIKLRSIYKWFSEWTDAEQGGCILEILSVCELDEVKYFSHCILQRLKDRADINRLPNLLLINIFRYLSVQDVLSVGLVCKRWKNLAEYQGLWKRNCHFLGARKDIPDIVEKIENAANGSAIDWKTAYKDLLLKIKERENRIEKLEMLKDEEEKGHKYNSDGEDTLKSQRKDLISSCTAQTQQSRDSSYDEKSNCADDAINGDEEVSEENEGKSVSSMSDFVNGDLRMIEDMVQQLSDQARRTGSRSGEEDLSLDIRPEHSIQAENKMSSTTENENLFKFVNVDGVMMLKRVRKLQGHLDAVVAMQFDKKRVLSGSADRTARLWDVRSGRCIHKLRGHKGGIRSVCFDKEFIVTGSWDTTIIIWSAVKFKRMKILDEHRDCVSCLEINDDILVSGSHDKTVKIWNKGTWTCERTLTGHHGCVMSLCIVENTKILTGGTDRIARLWNISDGSCLRSFVGSADVILTVKSYGDLAAAGTQDGNLLFWDVNTTKCEGMIAAHKGPLHGISFHGAHFVTAGGDQLVKEWDLSTCSCLRSLTGHKDVVLCVQSSSRRIVSGSADGTLRIWDLSSQL